MSTQIRSRQILIHGLMLVMAGLLWGFVVPHTPYLRLALCIFESGLNLPTDEGS